MMPEMLTYAEYRRIVIKMIKAKLNPKRRSFLMSRPDKIDELVSAVAIADWKYDKDRCDNREVYRAMRFYWAVSGIFGKLTKQTKILNRLREKYRQMRKASYELDTTIDEVDELTFLFNKMEINERDRGIILDRVGHEMTIEEVAQRHNMSRGRVKQIVSKFLSEIQQLHEG
jgi:hypothetical protein